jgi:N-sulfoglucosamine sulfohydrolase
MRPFAALLALLFALCSRAETRPNLVWIVGEDLGPELGSYGDTQAFTPNLDRLAAEGARYTRAFTHCAVCAPSRHGLITGQYPIKTGAMHMRSKLTATPTLFTKKLMDAGYHVAWPGKTDFNLASEENFCTSKEPWFRKDKPLPQPFFAYANFTQSHESQVRNDNNRYADNTARLTSAQRRDPAKMTLPPYWPDDPAVREEVARYYDLATSVDYDAGDVLAWLQRQGVASNTVVVFFGDHGRGMARHKRWVYDSGTHVPLLVRWPGKIAPGTVSGDLVSFVDLPATMLALAGVPVPAEYDGQVFLGPHAAPPRKFVYAHRDYMDEALDRIRAVRDTRYQYIRNFMPEVPYSLRNDYMEQGRTMQVWRQWAAEGKLNEVQSIHFRPTKPVEELYDTETDPHQVRNLADDPALATKKAELSTALDEWLRQTNDMAGRLTADQMVAQGIIKPRDPKYAERAKKSEPTKGKDARK